jgi:hypothetical protein
VLSIFVWPSKFSLRPRRRVLSKASHTVGKRSAVHLFFQLEECRRSASGKNILEHLLKIRLCFEITSRPFIRLFAETVDIINRKVTSECTQGMCPE